MTSRFSLVDLDEWTGAGHRAILLDDLERPVALDVLRAWKVKGHDTALVRLLEPINIGGVYHALLRQLWAPIRQFREATRAGRRSSLWKMLKRPTPKLGD